MHLSTEFGYISFAHALLLRYTFSRSTLTNALNQQLCTKTDRTRQLAEQPPELPRRIKCTWITVFYYQQRVSSSASSNEPGDQCYSQSTAFSGCSTLNFKCWAASTNRNSASQELKYKTVIIAKVICLEAWQHLNQLGVLTWIKLKWPKRLWLQKKHQVPVGRRLQTRLASHRCF